MEVIEPALSSTDQRPVGGARTESAPFPRVRQGYAAFPLEVRGVPSKTRQGSILSFSFSIIIDITLVAWLPFCSILISPNPTNSFTALLLTLRHSLVVLVDKTISPPTY